jgi:hypothetical protein
MDQDHAYLMINANLNWTQAFQKKNPKFSKMKRKTSFFLVENIFIFFNMDSTVGYKTSGNIWFPGRASDFSNYSITFFSSNKRILIRIIKYGPESNFMNADQSVLSSTDIHFFFS